MYYLDFPTLLYKYRKKLSLIGVKMKYNPLKTAHYGLDVLLQLNKGVREGDWKIFKTSSREFKALKGPEGEFMGELYLSGTNMNLGMIVEGHEFPLLLDFSVCFGGMDVNTPISKGTTHVFCRIPKMRTNLSKKTKGFPEVLDWLLNESPWASTFYTKSGKEAIEHGVVSNAKSPVNLMMAGLLLYKTLYSRTVNLSPLWVKLVEEGCHPLIALQQLCHWGSNPTCWHDISVTGSPFQKCTFFKPVINRMIANRPQYRSKSFYELNRYRGLGWDAKVQQGLRGGLTVNDRTVADTFMTKLEVKKLTQGELSLGVSGSLASSLRRHMQNAYPKVYDHRGNLRPDVKCDFAFEPVRKLYIEWTRGNFPKAYAA